MCLSPEDSRGWGEEVRSGMGGRTEGGGRGGHSGKAFSLYSGVEGGEADLEK